MSIVSAVVFRGLAGRILSYKWGLVQGERRISELMRKTFLGWLTLCLMLGIASAVQAEEPQSRAEEAQSDNAFPDRWMVRGGWNFVFDANTTFGINSDNGVSASADFANLLGGETQDNSWRIDSLYRFNQKHSLGFTYYDVDRTGDRVLLQDITIDNVTYSAGAQVHSELEIKLYRLFYNYSFYQNDKVELGLSGGMYVASIGVTLNANLTCTGGPSCTGGLSRSGAHRTR
jgi:hypothetical protein